MNFFIQENLRWQDSLYLPDITYKQVIKWFAIGVFGELIIVYFFYKSVVAIVCLGWIPFLCTYIQWNNWRKQMLRKMEVGFKEWIYYIKGGLHAGKSIENAIRSCKEGFRTHLEETHPIHLGLHQVYRGLELNIPVEECIAKLATETELEVIGDFATVFQITKRQGGRMVEVLDRTITQIYEKIELREEVYALFAAKKAEQRIMCAMPFGIMIFIGSTSKGYFDSLYHNLQGVCVMSVCLVVYLIGVWWGEKLTEGNA